MSLSKGANPVPSLIISEKALHLLLHGISGGLAGCLATLVIYPIDNIKTRLQALAKQERKNSAETHEIEKVKHKGIRAILKQILEEEGPTGLYKGVVPCLGNMIVNFSVYFFWYELFKGYFIKDNFSLTGYSLTALLSGLITATCSNPWGVIHTRVLFEKEKKMSVLKAIENIYEKEGIEGFFKGLGAGYVLVINPIIQFVVYEYLKKKFQGNTSSALVFLIGAISKALATSVTYPYSTLKLLLQANKKKNEGQLHLLRNIYRKKGIKGFFGGFGAKLSHTVINSALLLMIYERVQNIVKKILLALLSQKRIA